MVGLLTSVPTLLLGVIVVTLAVIVSIAGMLAVRRSIPHFKLEEHNEVAGFVYAVVGVLYAVLLALVVLAVWESFSAATELVDNEANSISQLYFDTEAMPESLRQQVRTTLAEYTHTIVHDEWPLLAQGGSSRRAEELRRDLFGLYLKWNPTSTGEAAWHAESLRRLNEVAGYRETRIFHGREGLPSVMWATLLLGGVITIGYSFLYGVKNALSQGVMVAALAATVSAALFLIVAMDYPFTGDVSVSREPLETVLSEMRAAEPHH